MKLGIAGLILVVCFATKSGGESVSCGKSCKGGPMSWGTLGRMTCCPAGYAMVIIHGKCSCHSPPDAASNSTTGEGSVMMVSGGYNRTRLKEEVQQMRASMREMALWLRAHMGGPGGR